MIAVGASACGPPTPSPASGELFERTEHGHFTEYRGVSRGLAWGDYDGDGDPDLFVSHPVYDGPDQRNALYRNESGKLVLVESEVGTAPPAGWEGATWVDVDGDRDLDLHLVGRDGAGSRFYANQDGVLEQVETDPFGDLVQSASMTCWADADGDGWLDAFVVGYGEDQNRLFRNRGGWIMETVPLAEVARGSGRSRACTWLHPGGRTLPVLAVANAREPNLLLSTAGDMQFSVDTMSAMWRDRAYGYGLSAADVNGDGEQDLFVANFDGGNSRLLGTGDGGFEAAPLGDALQSPASKGHVWADFNNDGWIDLYLGSGTPAPGMVNRLWLGTPAGGFALDTVGAFAQDADTSAAVAGADLDGDGDVDLAVANWGSSESADRLYLNQARGGRWLLVDLVGRAPNTGGVGARVSARFERRGESVWIHRWQTLSTGYAGQNEHRLHFGLGEATRVDSLAVRWPSGAVTRMGGLPADQVVRVQEGRP
ncbi:MAG: CRTAC1 family protein [Gemmatimonadetes bacterium]|nr:CRTAC1 family protein [Gemmatimonadota bacterium]